MALHTLRVPTAHHKRTVSTVYAFTHIMKKIDHTPRIDLKSWEIFIFQKDLKDFQTLNYNQEGKVKGLAPGMNCLKSYRDTILLSCLIGVNCHILVIADTECK